LVPTFYALGDTRTPVLASFLSVIVNLAGNLLLAWGLGMGHVGLALSTSLTMLFNFAQLSWFLRKRLRRLEGRRTADAFLRTALASLAMAAVVRLGVVASERFWRAGTIEAAVVVFAGIALGAALAWTLFRLARVAELAELESALAGIARRIGAAFGRSSPP
jgi:putative peptidoglycan lipid II flippase